MSYDRGGDGEEREDYGLQIEHHVQGGGDEGSYCDGDAYWDEGEVPNSDTGGDGLDYQEHHDNEIEARNIGETER